MKTGIAHRCHYASRYAPAYGPNLCADRFWVAPGAERLAPLGCRAYFPFLVERQLWRAPGERGIPYQRPDLVCMVPSRLTIRARRVNDRILKAYTQKGRADIQVHVGKGKVEFARMQFVRALHDLHFLAPET